MDNKQQDPTYLRAKLIEQLDYVNTCLVKFTCEDSNIYVKKTELLKQEYFKQMFDNKMKEHTSNEIKLQERAISVAYILNNMNHDANLVASINIFQFDEREIKEVFNLAAMWNIKNIIYELQNKYIPTKENIHIYLNMCNRLIESGSTDWKKHRMRVIDKFFDICDLCELDIEYNVIMIRSWYRLVKTAAYVIKYAADNEAVLLLIECMNIKELTELLGLLKMNELALFKQHIVDRLNKCVTLTSENLNRRYGNKSDKYKTRRQYLNGVDSEAIEKLKKKYPE